MARRVKEGDLSALDLDAVSADVLGNTARFACRNVRVADGIEDRGFAVVDVTHDANDRGAGNQLLLGILRIVEQAVLNADHHFVRSRYTEFVCNQCSGIEIDALVDRHHHAHQEEFLDHFPGCNHQLRCQLADQNVIRQLDCGRAFDHR